MTIVIDGRNDRGNHTMINYYSDYTILYSMHFVWTGQKDRESNKFKYEFTFKFKNKDFVAFQEEKFLVYLTKHEYVKAVVSMLNEHIHSAIMTGETKNLYLDLTAFETDDVALEAIVNAIDNNIAARTQEEAEQAQGVQDGTTK